jgi:hypothetical protein
VVPDRSAEAEIAKLQAKAATARREGRDIGARIGVVVSVATMLTALTIGDTQVWIAREQSESDRRLAKIDLGIKTAGFVLERRERFLAAPPHRKRPATPAPVCPSRPSGTCASSCTSPRGGITC